MTQSRFVHRFRMMWPGMVRHAGIVLAISLCSVGINTRTVWSQAQDTLHEQQEPSIVKLREGLYKVGSVILDRAQNEIRLEGEVNMQRGAIEYLACARGGKLHESVLVIDVEPYELQVALLLLGLEPGGNIEYQGDARTPQGDSLEIWVEWEEKGEMKRHRAEDCVFDLVEKRTMTPTPWIFTGSKIEDGVFIANVERSLMATYHDPYALLNHPLPTGADDTVYKVNEALVPKKGTPVTVLMRSLQSAMKH